MATPEAGALLGEEDVDNDLDQDVEMDDQETPRDDEAEEDGREGNIEGLIIKRTVKQSLDNFSEFHFDWDENPTDTTSSVEAPEAKLAGLWNDGDKIITSKVNQSRHFVCVDYPGVVKNIDRALATLEGTKNVTKILTENGRLAIFFRPEDPFCKPVYAPCTYSRNLLIKVRRRKKKNQSPGSMSGVGSDSKSESSDPYEYQLVVEGIVDRMYSFESFCDFQYLPVVKDTTAPGAPTRKTKYKEILTQLVPKMEDKRDEYLSRDIPLFMPPLAFSRRMLQAKFNFEDDTFTHRKGDVIDTARKNRYLGTIHVTFDHPQVPTEPHPEGSLSLEKLPTNYRESGLACISKLFEERPLWSKTALQIKVEPQFRIYVTYLLPMVAYYVTNGAWKALWCKFGYDPRKNIEAKIYQVIDFRIRKFNRSKVEGKRELWLKGVIKDLHQLPPSMTSTSESSPSMKFYTNLNATYQAGFGKGQTNDLVYTYHQGIMPPYRQMRYQICDIHHPEIQSKVHENDGQETTCTERDGWCNPDFTDICREILHNDVQKLQEAMQADKEQSDG